MKLGVLAEPVLVGREGELEELQRCFNQAIEGKGNTVFVSGDAGSGKSRLVNEFLTLAKERETAVLSGWCLSNVTTPYFPFIGAFNNYFSAQNSKENTKLRRSKVKSVPILEYSEDEEAEIKAWLAGPKLAEKTEPSLTPQAWKDLAVAAITKALLSMSARKTAVLLIDDLHWADSASLSLLHYIARSISAARVLVLATYRSEELHPDPEGRPHPLLETLRMMRREDIVREIKLPNLNQADVAALAEKMVGGSLHSELADKLAEESNGNPLFVVESLRMLNERGSLVQDRGRWRLSTDEVGIPDKIRDIILRRVDMLKPNQRRVLDLASVIGNRFDVGLLSAVLDQDRLEVLEALKAVGRSSSLVSFEGNSFEFDHALFKETIYGEIFPPLRQEYHARIAEKIETQSRGAKVVAVNDLAYHYAHAGNKEKAVKYTLAAARDALARFSNAEAIRQYTFVLDSTAASSEHLNERTAALEGLGDALMASMLFGEAAKTFEQLSAAAESGLVKLRALRKAMYCSAARMGYSEHWLKLSEEAEAYGQFDRLEHARLHLHRGSVQRFTNAEEALEDVEGALKVFEEEFSLPDVASALADIFFFYVVEDRPEDLLAAILRSVKLYEELGDLRGQVLAGSRLGLAFDISGFNQEAEDADEKTFKIGEEIGDYQIMALRRMALCVRYEDSDLRKAVALTLEAADHAEKTDSYGIWAVCYARLVEYYAKLGEIERAEEFAKKIERLYDEKPNVVKGFEELELGRAYLFSAKGQFEAANVIFGKTPLESPWGPQAGARWKKGYAWSLAKQGRTEEAKIMLQGVQKVLEKRAKTKERLEHTIIQTYLMASREIGVGEKLKVRLDIVNVAKNLARLLKVEGLIPPEFEVLEMPSYCSVRNGAIEFGERDLGPFTVEPLKLTLRATRSGAFTLDPKVTYVDDMGQTKTSKPNPVNVSIRPTLHLRIGDETISVPVLPGRVATGFADLDALLYGGIPEKYSVLLASPLTDEREQLVKRFLETGAKVSEISFYITAEAADTMALAEEYPLDFYLFVCNPQVDSIVPILPNMYKLKGVENLTEIDIALAKALRTLDSSVPSPRRLCIGIVSDVLLQHRVVNTRRWLGSLLATLKSRGFTTLAVIDPHMHSPEEVQAILSLFDGEIRVVEKETAQGVRQTLRVKRLFNQRFSDGEVVLDRRKLEQ